MPSLDIGLINHLIFNMVLVYKDLHLYKKHTNQVVFFKLKVKSESETLFDTTLLSP